MCQAIRCTHPNCSCDCFAPGLGRGSRRTCSTCQHGWISHGKSARSLPSPSAACAPAPAPAPVLSATGVRARARTRAALPNCVAGPRCAAELSGSGSALNQLSLRARPARARAGSEESALSLSAMHCMPCRSGGRQCEMIDWGNTDHLAGSQRLQPCSLCTHRASERETSD